MADEKKASKKKTPAKKAKASEKKGDIRIAIGAKSPLGKEAGVEDWNLDGVEINESGDRIAVAYLTTQQLYEMGWIRRKF